MSGEYQFQSPLDIAKQAELDLNSLQAKQGHEGSTSTMESGVDETVTAKFPGSSVEYGSAASGAGNNRDIPLSEGGSMNKTTGKLSESGDFEGEGGLGDKEEKLIEEEGGRDEVGGNARR